MLPLGDPTKLDYQSPPNRPTPEARLVALKEIVGNAHKPGERAVGRSEKNGGKPGETVKALAQSIVADGLLCPIAVWANPETPGLYKIIAGRRRLDAFKRLKLESIPAIIYEGISEEEARRITLAENLFRKGLTAIQRARHMQEWVRSHVPETMASWSRKDGEAASEPTAPQDEASPARAADGSGGTSSRKRPPNARSEYGSGATAELKQQAEERGVSSRTLLRSAAVAAAFTPEEIDALENAPNKISGKDLAVMAKVPRPQRARVVELVVSGRPVADAIREAAPLTGGKIGLDDLTDEEWLDVCCGKADDPTSTRGKVKNREMYDNDALLYRASRKERKALAKTCQKRMKAASANGQLGPFGKTLKSLFVIEHPRDWFACGKCSGSGTVTVETSHEVGGREMKCPDCWGNGYIVRKDYALQRKFEGPRTTSPSKVAYNPAPSGKPYTGNFREADGGEPVEF